MKKVILIYFNSFVLFILFSFIVFSDMKAQERIVDDAAITNFRSFQIETWYGQFESVFMPAIGANQWLEIGFGVIFDSEDDFNFHGVLPEVKAVKNNFEIDGYSWGGVMGLSLNKELKADEFYFYAPFSRSLFSNALVLHINAGINYSFSTPMT